MKHILHPRHCAAFICVIGTIGASVAGAPAAAAPPAAPSAGAYTWHIETVDSTGTVGQFASLALQPGTDKPYISYYDDTHGDLKLAFPVPAGAGDCGPQNNWSCNSIAFQNNADYGLQSSIAFPGSGNWSVAYSNVTFGSNAFRGIPAPGADEIFWQPIDEPGNIVVANALRFDASNISNVSYGMFDGNAGKSYIKRAKYHGLGGNCGGGFWNCEIVTETSGLHMYNTLEFIDNLAFVFYADANKHLALAVNASVNCGVPVNWNCTTIDISSTVNGMMSAVVSRTQGSQGIGYLGVAYVGDTDLRYAHLITTPATTGNCGVIDMPMQCDVIDAVGAADNGQLLGASMTLLNGQPVIAYTAHFRGHAVLKVAYPQANGNCGPGKFGGLTWRCDIIDGGANDAGYYPALKVDSTGRIHIAYFDVTTGDLKYALSDPLAPTPTPTPFGTPAPTATATATATALPDPRRLYLPVALRLSPKP